MGGPSFFAKRSLGQNFLIDRDIASRMVAMAGDLRESSVIEVGPGKGALTRALLATSVRQIIAVETDLRMEEFLAPLVQASQGRLSLLFADAKKIDLATLLPKPRILVSNLPYNVGTHLLVQWLKQLAIDPQCYQGFVLTFQKEVAERISAQPGDSSYGRLSVLAGWMTQVEKTMRIPPEAFRPSPTIDSQALLLRPRPRPLPPGWLAPPKALETITACVFQQRRKTLRSSLRSLKVPALVDTGPDSLLDTGADSCPVDLSLRPQVLKIEDFCALARLWDSCADPEKHAQNNNPKPAKKKQKKPTPPSLS